MKGLVLDVETTISNKGNPFDETNKLCYVGCYDGNVSVLHSIEYGSEPYGNVLADVQASVDACELIIGFNLKFDLHWIRRYGIHYSTKRVWDCQLVHFILTGQSQSYPSLNGVAAHYGLDSKLDVVSTEYWKNGIDTPDVPEDILRDYLQKDLELTHQVYLKQLEEVKASSPQLQRLISLHNQDLMVLEEMEYNGILFNEAECVRLGIELEADVRRLDELMYSYHNLPEFNPSSGEHLSTLLYGGTIKIKRKEVVGVFKTGARAGEPKERWIEYSFDYPKMVTPLKGSELEKEGYYRTDDQTLKNLKGSKKVKELIELLLHRAVLEKRLTAYYVGLVKLRKEMKWSEGKLHGVLNQCVARTGRLSSSKPNLQNFDGEIKQLFGSRYG